MKRLLYLMENVLETDTKNKNLVFFCNYLKKNGIDVEFVSTENEQNKKIYNFGDNIKLVKLGSGWVIKEKHLIFPVVYLIKNLNNYDALWCYLNRPSSIYAVMIKKIFNKKLIVKCDSAVPQKEKNFLKAIWKYLVVKMPLRNADFVIAESPRVFSEVKKINKNVVIIPNSIPLKKFEEINKKLGRIKKENIVLSVGRIEPIKGTLDLIEAFSIFYQHNKDWKLLIVGPLSNREYVEKIKKRINELFTSKKEKDSVLLLGSRYETELFEIMKKSKIFCIASHPGGDGLSNVLPQAMYFECNPVVTNVGDLNYFLDGLNFKLVEPNNPVELSSAFNKSKNKKDENIKKSIIKDFTWEKNIKKLDKAIRIIKNGQ